MAFSNGKKTPYGSQKTAFSAVIDKVIQKTGLTAEKVIRRVALDAFVRCIKKSPVDTGRFRGNWNVGINTSDTFYDVDKKDKQPYDSPPSPERFAEGQVQTLKAKVGDTIYITNNLPYAVPLERGYSRQAPNPPGIVKSAVSDIFGELDAIVKAAKDDRS